MSQAQPGCCYKILPSLCLLPGTGAAAISTPGLSLLHPQDRKLLPYTNPLPLGSIPGQLWLSGKPGLEMLLAVALGDVEVNREKRVWV